MGKRLSCIITHDSCFHRLLRKAATSLRTQGSSISVYLSPLLAVVSIHVSLAHSYGTWRKDAVPAEPYGTDMALPCTAQTDFHPVLLLIYGKGQTGGSLLKQKENITKKKDKNLVGESEL